jgi:hypothetical protein
MRTGDGPPKGTKATGAADYMSSSGQSQPGGGSCPHCGRPFKKRRSGSRHVRRGAYAFSAALIFAGLVAGGLIKRHEDNRTAARRQAASLQLIAHREQLSEEATNRRTSRVQLETAIAADARKLSRHGVLEGPIQGATCTPMEGPESTSPGPSITTYNCIAVRRRRGRTIEGARFFATINGRSGRFTFGGD